MPNIDNNQYGDVSRQLNAITPEQIRPYDTLNIQPPIYTLVAKPPEIICNQVAELSSRLSQLYPNHYYYPREQLHVTLQYIGTVITPEEISNIQRVVSGKVCEVFVRGIGINTRGASSPVYDTRKETIFRLREELRTELNISTNYAGNNPVWDQLMWINFMRFRSRPSTSFLNVIKDNASIEIGSFTIKQWELYKTSSRVLESDKSELIHTFII